MSGSYGLYVAIGIIITVLRVVGIGAIFAYGIIRGSRARRPLLFLSGGLLLVSLIIGNALPGVLVGTFGLGASQAISLLSAVLDIAGIAVLMYAFVQADGGDRPSGPGAGMDARSGQQGQQQHPPTHHQQQPGQGWQTPGQHPGQQGQSGQNHPGQGGGTNWTNQGWNQH